MVLQSPLASGVRTACPTCCAEALLSRVDVFVNVDKVVRNTSHKRMLERQAPPSRGPWAKTLVPLLRQDASSADRF